MKLRFFFLTLVVAMLSSVSLFSQNSSISDQNLYDRYDGQWPQGEGVLYSYKDGLIIGSFVKGRPEGRCVCYKTNGEVYWGNFKKGKATGKGRIYRDNGIVVAGDYKNGKYHGIDTLYRSDGTMLVGKFRNGKLKTVLAGERKFLGEAAGVQLAEKPEYPRVDLMKKQEDFLKELELKWEERNVRIREKAGLVSPKFQGGDVDDFALWVNSNLEYPQSSSLREGSRTVIVEFTVGLDGVVSGAHAVFGSDPVLNEAAVAAVSKSPRWEPASYNGISRSISMTVPVVFSNE